MLRKQNYSVFEVADGGAAVELFDANAASIGIVLLDLTMPGLPGSEVVRELRRIQPDIRIIVTTAYGPDAAADALGSERGWLFLRKPYTLTQLLKLLQENLNA
jgi:CheY-like chemotaxis protein